MSQVLVISPHPDDESIGCGGTLRQHVLSGDTVRVLFLTSGENGGHGRTPELTVAVREREAHDAAQVLGVTELDFWRQPDGKLRATAELVERLVRVLRRRRPSIIYAPHDDEMHPDHRAATRLVRRAVSALSENRRPEVRLYEVWTPLQILDEIIDITSTIEVKLQAVRMYRCQCDVLSFDDAVQGLNRYRGEMHCWPEGEYAEVFRRLPR
jgi:LmbE family N-acetylglucosaminyl deacetylase